MKVILKRSDPIVRRLREARDRKNGSLVFCEGQKVVEELLRSSWETASLYCTKERHPTANKLLANAKKQVPLTVLSDDVMNFCSDVATPPGLIALAKPSRLFDHDRDRSLEGSLNLVIHNVQLPQNVGALLRTAEAAGVDQVYLTDQAADPWGPKALRGSSGSIFRLAINPKRSLETVIAELRTKKIRCVAATQNGRLVYDNMDWTGGIALVMGSEGAGFTQKEIFVFDDTIKIPMKGRVESLNVSTAAAVCLFEAARQRKNEAER